MSRRGDRLDLGPTRVDAAEKVRGQIKFAADRHPGELLYAALVTSTVRTGRIVAIDTVRAAEVGGVELIMDHRMLGDSIGPGRFLYDGGQFHTAFNPMSSSEIRYAGQIVAVVVATSIETAEHAARLVDIRYSRASHEPRTAEHGRGTDEIEVYRLDKGDTEAALRSSVHVVEQEYTTPIQHHNPIELFSATATWSAAGLEVRVPTQWVMGERQALAETLGIPPDTVHVICPAVGGAFGGKCSPLWHTVFAAEASRRTQRPVKLHVTRSQMFTVGPFRPASRHVVTLAADATGRLTAYRHHIASHTSRSDVVALTSTHLSARVYDFPSIATRETVQPTDLNSPGFMRAPREFPAAFALESAMDELAYEVGLDPVELRRRNEPLRDPVDGYPYSSRSLMACYDRGAEIFGWSARDERVGSMRGADGTLRGWGCATATYPALGGGPCECRITISSDGTVLVELAAHDLGTGAQTILGQICADALGIDLGQVRVSLGDSRLPLGPMAAGSSTTASAGSAVLLAAAEARRLLLVQACSAFGLAASVADDLQISDGDLCSPDGDRLSFGGVVAGTANGQLVVQKTWVPAGVTDTALESARRGGFAMGDSVQNRQVMSSYGAHFAEVAIHPVTGQVRVLRMVGVFAVGRVMNERLLRSQLEGGMIWGLSHALMEETTLDAAHGRFVNTDLAGYHFAACADSPDMVVDTVAETDADVNPLGVKGAGEVGVVGSSAAITNAVFHATGVRVRHLPIRLHDVPVPASLITSRAGRSLPEP